MGKRVYLGMTKPFLPQRGGYRSLKVYRVTTLIYDLTSIGRVWALSDEQDGVMILYHACVHECSLLDGHVVFLELFIQGIQKNLRHAWCFAV